MTHLYIVPGWFFGFDITMELFFGIITFAVAATAYKVYKISRDKPMRNFSIGFLLISLSYIVWAAINIFLLSKVQGDLRELALDNMALIGQIGIYAHILLLAIGLITLVYATLAIKNARIYYLMLGLGLLTIASSFNKIATFRIVSVFLLVYISYHFFIQWRTHKNKKLLYSFIAFSLLLLSNLEFAFSATFYLAYVTGHILELAAYLIILKNLITTTFTRQIP